MQGFFQTIEDVQEKADMARLLNVNEDDVAIMAEKGGEISTTAGGLRAANAKSGGALIEAVKNNIALDAEQISLSAMELRKELRKAYDGLSDAQKVDLNNEVNAIVVSAIEAGATKEVANSIRPLFISRAMVANPDNPAQFYKDHPLRFQKGDFAEDGGFNMVTNTKLSSNTEVNIVDVTELGIPSIKTQADKIKLVKDLVGVQISLPYTNATGGIKNRKKGRHVVSSSYAEGRKDVTRLKALSVLKEVLEKSIYVDKHLDKKGSGNYFIEFFVPIKDNDTISTFRITAKETGKSVNNYEIQEAEFYDFIKEKTTQLAPLPNKIDKDVTAPPVVSSTISIREMLSNVKDKNGNFYLDEKGNLNYEFGVLKALEQGKSFNQLAWHGSPYRFLKFDLGAIGTGEGAQVFDRWFACDAQITVVE